MPDMLVKLYTLPDLTPYVTQLATEGIEIRRALTSDGPVLSHWVGQHFTDAWALGCDVALTQRPITCFLAVHYDVRTSPPHDAYDLPAELLLGFACYDVASRGMVGAMGVHPTYQGRNIGTALLLATLHAMREEGYMYAIIGWAGPVEFYVKTVGATIIPESEPGGFRGPLRGA